MAVMDAAWERLLGLPLVQAQQLLGAGNVPFRVLVTRASARRGEDDEPQSRGTQRVIRVTKDAEGVLVVTVSAFQDGDPKQL